MRLVPKAEVVVDPKAVLGPMSEPVVGPVPLPGPNSEVGGASAANGELVAGPRVDPDPKKDFDVLPVPKAEFSVDPRLVADPRLVTDPRLVADPNTGLLAALVPTAGSTTKPAEFPAPRKGMAETPFVVLLGVLFWAGGVFIGSVGLATRLGGETVFDGNWKFLSVDCCSCTVDWATSVNG